MKMAYRERWEAEIAEMRRVLAGFAMNEEWSRMPSTARRASAHTPTARERMEGGRIVAGRIDLRSLGLRVEPRHGPADRNERVPAAVS
jgi:hypothetical protein